MSVGRGVSLKVEIERACVGGERSVIEGGERESLCRWWRYVSLMWREKACVVGRGVSLKVKREMVSVEILRL